jgi:hypothetical protein
MQPDKKTPADQTNKWLGDIYKQMEEQVKQSNSDRAVMEQFKKDLFKAFDTIVSAIPGANTVWRLAAPSFGDGIGAI